MERLTNLLACLILVLVLAGPAAAQTNDLVILNGRVIDPETMLDATLNVGVKNGKIAIITKDKITGKETIDATGLVVSPGFIDTRFHKLTSKACGIHRHEVQQTKGEYNETHSQNVGLSGCGVDACSTGHTS